MLELSDLDIIPLKPLDELFQLPCSAAMVRGQGKEIHGAEVDGCRFWALTTRTTHGGSWGGINAGLILRREVSHALAATNGEDGGGKDVSQRNLEDYRDHGCRREGQRISKDICGREGHHSCLRLDGAKGARGSCASHKGLAGMLRQGRGVCFLWKSSKNHALQKVVSTLDSCGSELDDGTRQPCDCEMVAGSGVGAP